MDKNQNSLHINTPITLPAGMFPVLKAQIAIDRKVEKRILFRTWGGIGDQICTEPTLRYAIKKFKDCDIYLASQQPQLFKHLKFKKVFDLNNVDDHPNYENYFVLQTIVNQDAMNLPVQFFAHMLTHCVDYPSLLALRSTLPNEDKEIQMFPDEPKEKINIPDNAVFIHAGRHWQSKTFPKEFWDSIIRGLIENKCVPVLIGADTDDNRGTVDVDNSGCLDLRNKLSIEESIYYLKNAKILLTNDSSPLHMAACGDAWILYFATCKHYDHIAHWRKGQFGYKMKNLSLGGIWDIIDYCPNKENDISAENVGKHLLEWLPDPESVIVECLNLLD